MTTPAQPSIRCGKCGAEVVGRYCADCGSAANVRRDLSVKHFLREAAAAITDVDSVLVASFRDLIIRPGALTASYLAGERYRYLAPFRVFLICNVVYFLAAAELEMGVLSTPLSTQLDAMIYKPITRNVVSRRLNLEGVALTPAERATRDSVKRDFQTRYDGATQGVAKAMLVVLIPLYALIFQLLFIGSGRFFAEHLVFSTHLVSFLIVSILAATYALSGLYLFLSYTVRYRLSVGEAGYGMIIFGLFGGYALFALRRVYGVGWVGAAVRTGVVVLTVLPLIVAFKFILFFATLYWMS